MSLVQKSVPGGHLAVHLSLHRNRMNISGQLQALYEARDKASTGEHLSFYKVTDSLLETQYDCRGN